MDGPQAKFTYDASYDYLLSSRAVEGLSQQWYSNGHSFSFMGEWSIKSGIGLGYGFGFSVHNLHNNLAYVQVMPDPLDAGILTLSADSSYAINKQNISYIDVPVEFRFRGRSTNKGWYFRMSAGVRLGYRIASSAYHRSEDYAIRQYRVFETPPYRAKVYARIGAGKVALNVGFDLIPVLKEQWPGFVPANYEPVEFRMLSAGVSLQL